MATKKNPNDIYPKGVIHAESLEDMEGKEYSHIIFNKRLQEGWDDPEVYLAYIDEDSNSANRITQIIGRVLRQPNGTHFEDEAFNTAYFILNCKEGNYEKVINNVRKYLEREGVVGINIRTPKEEPVSTKAKIPMQLPTLRLTIERKIDDLRKALQDIIIPGGFPEEWCKNPGIAVVQKVSTMDGALKGPIEEERFGENASLSLKDAVREALNEQNPAIWPNLDSAWMDQVEWSQRFLRGSRAEKEAHERTVTKLIPIYNNSVDIALVKFPIHYYGDIDQRPKNKIFYKNSLHAWYSGLNNDEIEAAEAIDSTGVTWARNGVKGTSFGIPLPHPTEQGGRRFYPDFLVWLPNNWFLAIEVKGKHLLTDALNYKLLSLPQGIRVAMINKEKGRFYRKTSGELSWSYESDIFTSVVNMINETKQLQPCVKYIANN